MGLLDLLDSPEGRLGVALLSASGPTAQPTSVGQRLASALQSVQAQQDGDLRRQYVRSQINENNGQAAARQSQLQQERAIQDFVTQRMQQPTGASISPGPRGAPGPTISSGLLGAIDGQGTPIAAGLLANASPQVGAGGPMATAASAGSFPLSLRDITMLTTLGAKQGPALFEQFKYAVDGAKREPGAYYVDPSTGAVSYTPKLDVGMELSPNGQVRPLEGFASSNAAIKGAEAGAVARATEGAKFPFTVAADRARQETQAGLDVVRVVGADGAEYYVPRMALTKGQGTSASPGVAGVGGEGGGYVAARNPITQQSQIALNDNWLKNAYQPTLDAGKSAANTQAGIEAIRNIGASTGWGTNAKAYAASVLEGLGVAPGNAQLFAANAQKFQAVAMDKVNAELLLQKGVQARDDAERAKQTFVSLQNTPEANAFILDFVTAKANMDQRRAQYYEAALPLAQRSGDLTRVDREWRKVSGTIWADPILQRWKK